jgi:hypothetical protein
MRMVGMFVNLLHINVMRMVGMFVSLLHINVMRMVGMFVSLLHINVVGIKKRYHSVTKHHSFRISNFIDEVW